jgi:hypothetical protein
VTRAAKGGDCKSPAYSFGGSSPPFSTISQVKCRSPNNAGIAVDVQFRTVVRSPTGSRIIAGTAEVVGIPGRPGWQFRSAYIREGLRVRAADFWEQAAVRSYLCSDSVSDKITALWIKMRETTEDGENAQADEDRFANAPRAPGP